MEIRDKTQQGLLKILAVLSTAVYGAQAVARSDGRVAQISVYSLMKAQERDTSRLAKGKEIAPKMEQESIQQLAIVLSGAQAAERGSHDAFPSGSDAGK